MLSPPSLSIDYRENEIKLLLLPLLLFYFNFFLDLLFAYLLCFEYQVMRCRGAQAPLT